MKQVTYQIRGELTEPMIPAVVASCSALPGVRRVQLTPEGEGCATLILSCLSEPTEAMESGLSSVMNTKGLEVDLASRAITDAPEESAPVRPASPEFNTTPSPAQAPAPAPAAPPVGPRKTVALTAAIAAMVTAVVLTVLITFSVTVSYMKNDTPPTADNGQGAPESEKTVFDQMEFLDRLFRSFTVLEMDENFEDFILKSYVAATGDLYAEYFTAEELDALMGEQNGEMCGIGVNVVNGTCNVGGIEYQSIVVANVYPDSPAEEAGVLPGDYIMYVGTGEDKTLIHEIGYTEALNRMTGEEGTACTFTVFRFTGTEQYEEVEISAIRKKMTTRSVTGRVYSLDSTVGIIKMTGFDYTTRDQFVEVLESLQAEGCTSFVFDLRGNPGGLLTSVEDVLTFFVEEGDTIISVKDNTGREDVTKLTVTESGQVWCGSGEMKREDVGKYRELKFSVLVSQYSASAAELFTANMRDHGLCQIVGVKTFGKGSMQSTIPLSQYGYEGALKLTTAYYFPPSGVGYHDIGIEPDISVEIDEQYQNININLLTDEQDNQLAAAVAAAKADTPN